LSILKNKKTLFLLIAILLLIIDFSAKLIALRAKSFNLKLIKFGLSKNYGLFFWPVKQELLIIFSVIFLFLLFVFLIKKGKQNFLLSFFLLLIGLGGLSNLFDRIFYGFVVDYLWVFFIPFSWFNFADVMIFFGCLLSLRLVLQKQVPSSKLKKTIENKSGHKNEDQKNPFPSNG